jgi:hypothetical protein
MQANAPNVESLSGEGHPFPDHPVGAESGELPTGVVERTCAERALCVRGNFAWNVVVGLVMVRRIFVYLSLVVPVFAAACGGGGGNATSSSPATRPPAPTTSRVSTCGQYILTATVGKRVVPLADCAGLAGMTELPAVSITRGQVVSIGHQSLTVHLVGDSPGVVSISGDRLTGNRAGRTTLTESGALCAPSDKTGVQPKSCAFLTVTVH